MECDVIRDLIPLVKEDLASNTSTKLVEDHIKDCEDCKRFYQSLDENIIANEVKENKPLEFLSKSVKNDRILYGFMIGSFLLSLFLVIASFLTYPHPVDYKDGLISKDFKDDKIVLNFSDEVTRSYIDFDSYDGAKTAYIDGSYTYLDRILGGRSVGINLNKADADIVFYNNNGDKAAKVIYDPRGYMLNGGSSQLPRLALAMYAILVIGIFIVLFLLVLTVLRKKSKYTKIRILSLPISYLLSTFLIKGKDLTSHYLLRDFGYIVFTAVAVYLFIIALTLYFERKKITKI